MRAIAFSNKKGGSTKTTTVVNLAASIAEQGRKVLIIDLDEQGNATTWCDPAGYNPAAGDRGVFDLFADRGKNIDDLLYPTNTDGVQLIPSSHWLAGIDKALAQEPGAEQILKLKLRKLDPDRFDYVFFDCPPTMGVMTVNALNAANEVIIPVETSVLNLSGLAQILGYIEMVRERINPDIRVTGILAARVDNRTNRSRDVMRKLRERFPELVYKTFIRENTKLGEAPSYTPIVAYDPKGSGTEDFRNLAQEVLAQEMTSGSLEGANGRSAN
jgi:chromosome partitioning protein